MIKTIEMREFVCDLCDSRVLHHSSTLQWPEGWVEYYFKASGFAVCRQCHKDHPKTVRLVKGIFRVLHDAQ